MTNRGRLTYSVEELIPYINWVYFFHSWGFAPRFAAVAHTCSCMACRSSWLASFPIAEQPKANEAAKLYDEAAKLLSQLEGKLTIQSLYRLCPANAEGDNLVIDGIIFPLLRQQTPHKDGSPHLCLSDFIRPLSSGKPDTVGFFASSVRSLSPNVGTHPGVSYATSNNEGTSKDKGMSLMNHPSKRNFRTHQDASLQRNLSPLPTGVRQGERLDCDPYQSLLLQTLTDRLAEAATEKMHLHVRRKAWGYAPDENLSIPDLLQEKFQGIRPAVGYPSLPDQSVCFLIDQLIDMKQIGITLTENGAMHPHASVCGLMLAHPAARYFSVGRIDEAQLRDYTRRRGLPIERMRKFLAANL